LPAQKR